MSRTRFAARVTDFLCIRMVAWMLAITLALTAAICVGIGWFVLMRRLIPAPAWLGWVELAVAIVVGILCHRFLEPQLMRLLRVRPPQSR